MTMKQVKKIPAYWQAAKEYLTRNDAVLADLIQKIAPEKTLFSKQDPFFTFAKIIVGQQISVQAADAIFGRFEALFSQKLSAKSFLELDQKKILALGFSKSKVRYLSNIARAIEEEKFLEHYQQLRTVKEKEKKLMEIVGIGQWSADMFLIFHDLEADICPLGDIGLLNAINKHYHVKSNEDIMKIVKPWQPYSSVATWFLWCDIDDEIVAY